jgi:hypothetical protein
MVNYFSRRLFLSAAAGTFAAALMARDDVPNAMPDRLDHLLLGCNNLDRGISFVEEHTGMRAAFGGAHPGAGTQNALLSLGERHYLEIIAPDPAQPDAKEPLKLALEKLSEPRLVRWAAHPGDLATFAKRLREADIEFEGPTPGSRKRPDGRVLHWQALALKDDASGLLPFFIEWSADSLHPSADSPVGCRLTGFKLVTPEPERLTKMAALLALNVPIAKGDRARLRATLTGPKGNLELSS